MRLNEQISIYRKRLGLTQCQLSKLLGVKRQTVSDWETGKYMPLFQNIVLLEHLLGQRLTVDSEELPQKEAANG